MSDFRGDYLGFSFGTKPDGSPMHSSDLGIVRTSDGSRFNENLLPTMQDKTVQVPGGDGTYYFGSYYTQRQFNISFAFDSLTEQQIATLKSHFGDKQIHDLIFDEIPYKVWSAKVTGTATIKYIPFSEGITNRIYKGEGTIQFTCYYPFARCRFKTRQEYEAINCLNINEWWEASHIDDGGNFGDVPVPFTAFLNTEQGSIFSDKITWKNLPITYTIVKNNESITYPARGVLNTRIGVVEQEYDKANTITSDGTTKNTPSWEKTGNILNKYVTGDLTTKIPVGETVADVEFTCLYI